VNELLRAVFGSEVSSEILKRCAPDRRIRQRELMSDLLRKGYSNKTVIEKLRKLVELGVLEQGMERISVGKRSVWTKWYAPTPLGKWIVFLTLSPKEAPREAVEDALSELFKMYAQSAIGLCNRYGINVETFKSSLEEAYLSETMKGTPEAQPVPSVIVYGSAAWDIEIFPKRLPEPDQSVYVEKTLELPGGSGVNVALALSKLGVPTAFVGKLALDASGASVLSELKRRGVNVSEVTVESSLKTPRSFVVVGREGEKRIYVLGGANAALSISSPSEASWKLTEKSKLVYVGETFLEVAEVVTGFAKTRGKMVVYRPTTPFLELGLSKLANVIRNAAIFLINEAGWTILRDSSKRLEKPSDVLRLGPETVIVTRGSRGCTVYRRKRSFETPGFEVKSVDSTGAGDAFTAGLIKALLDERSITDCARYACAAAALSVTRAGSRSEALSVAGVEELLRAG
jgi:ribokinase